MSTEREAKQADPRRVALDVPGPADSHSQADDERISDVPLAEDIDIQRWLDDGGATIPSD